MNLHALDLLNLIYRWHQLKAVHGQIMCGLDHAGPSLQGQLVEKVGLPCPRCGAAL